MVKSINSGTMIESAVCPHFPNRGRVITSEVNDIPNVYSLFIREKSLSSGDNACPLTHAKGNVQQNTRKTNSTPSDDKKEMLEAQDDKAI